MDSDEHHVTVDEDRKLSGRIDFEECGTAVLAGEHVDGNGLEVDGQFLKRPPYADRAGRSEFIELHGFPRSIWSEAAQRGSLRLTMCQAPVFPPGRISQGSGRSKCPWHPGIAIAVTHSSLHSPRPHTARQRRQSIRHFSGVA